MLFRSQPFTFIFMHLFIGLVGMLSLAVPVLQIAATLATPFLTAGFYQAMLTKQRGGRIMLVDIFKPFSAKGRRLGLFRLGLYQMAGGILLAMLANMLFADALALLSQPDIDPQTAMQQLAERISAAQVVTFVAALAMYMMLFAYAVPLVYFGHNKRILEVLKASLMAFFHNMGALTVFGLIVAALMLLSAGLSFLPLLFLMPICYISFFVSFQAIFMPELAVTGEVRRASSDDGGRFDA